MSHALSFDPPDPLQYFAMLAAAPHELPLGLYLQPATPRAILERMLRKLKAIHRGADDARALRAVQERLAILLPDEPGRRRVRALSGRLARWRALPPPALH